MHRSVGVVKVNHRGEYLDEYWSIHVAAEINGVSDGYVKDRCEHITSRGIYRQDKDGNWFTFVYLKDFKIKK